MDLTLSFSAHPSEDVLEAYALKRLPEPQIPGVEEHLLVCEACQHVLADLDVFIASIKSVSPQGAPVKATRFPLWRPALAAAAVLAIGVFFWWDSGASPVPATIILSSMRGSETVASTGPANVPLDLNIASTQVDSRDFRIDVVTADGAQAWSGGLTRSADGGAVVRVDKKLAAGSYWVRLYGPDNRLLQEYGLRLN